MLGITMYVGPRMFVLMMPSKKYSLERFCCPWNEGSEKPDPGIPTLPSQQPTLRFCEVETGVTPGGSVNNWVKFLPFRGRSFTTLSWITFPRCVLIACRSDAAA